MKNDINITLCSPEEYGVINILAPITDLAIVMLDKSYLRTLIAENGHIKEEIDDSGVFGNMELVIFTVTRDIFCVLPI